MPVTFSYQMSGCVLIVNQHVPGIVASQEMADAVGSKHTQLVETPDGEVAVYNTLQVVNIKQPSQQASISVTQLGEGFVQRLVRVSQIAFEKALEDQRGVAVGINFNATLELSKRTANSVVLDLLSEKIAAQRGTSTAPLTSAGLKLLYDKKPWVATISLDVGPNNDKQLACAVNFNFNRPTRTDVRHIREAERLRVWFERAVKEIVGESQDD